MVGNQRREPVAIPNPNLEPEYKIDNLVSYEGVDAYTCIVENQYISTHYGDDPNPFQPNVRFYKFTISQRSDVWLDVVNNGGKREYENLGIFLFDSSGSLIESSDTESYDESLYAQDLTPGKYYIGIDIVGPIVNTLFSLTSTFNPEPYLTNTENSTPQTYEDTVQQAYIAYYGRPADRDGLNFWIEELAKYDGDLSGIIMAFGTSEEFNTNYGGLSQSELVATIYQQMFNRSPEDEGLAYWVDMLESGEKSLQTITLDVLYGARGTDSSIIHNKLNVAKYFTSNLPTDGDYYIDWSAAGNMVHGVGGSSEDLETFYGLCDAFMDEARLHPLYPTVEDTSTHSELDIFIVSEKEYAETDDLDQAIATEFGDEYMLADWKDLEKYQAEQGGSSIEELLHETDSQSCFVSNDGDGFFTSSRHYIARDRESPVINFVRQQEYLEGDGDVSLVAVSDISTNVLAVRKDYSTIFPDVDSDNSDSNYFMGVVPSNLVGSYDLLSVWITLADGQSSHLDVEQRWDMNGSLSMDGSTITANIFGGLDDIIGYGTTSYSINDNVIFLPDEPATSAIYTTDDEFLYTNFYRISEQAPEIASVSMTWIYEGA